MRRHREGSGLTFRAMAERMGLHWQSLQRLEAGPHVPRLTTAILIAQFFGTDLTTFLAHGDTKTVDTQD